MVLLQKVPPVLTTSNQSATQQSPATSASHSELLSPRYCNSTGSLEILLSTSRVSAGQTWQTNNEADTLNTDGFPSPTSLKT